MHQRFPSSSHHEDRPELPSLEVVAKSQTQLPPTADSGYYRSSTHTGEIWMDNVCKIFIPDDDEELQLRICAVSEVIED